MNTIVRTDQGIIRLVPTVIETVKIILRQYHAGYITCELIQQEINKQLTNQYITKAEIKRALCIIVQDSVKRKQEKLPIDNAA